MIFHFLAKGVHEQPQLILVSRIVLFILRPLASRAAKGYQGQSPWLVGIRSTFAVPHLAQSSEHPKLSRLFAAPTLECSDVRLGWQETRKRVLELRRPVTCRERSARLVG